MLIHEGNHGLETTVIDNGETYLFISGWDMPIVRNSVNHKQKIEYDPEAKGYRPFELFNECINDFITNEIRENVKKRTKNIIFSSTEDSLYANAYFVVEEFYQLYKPEIIESRKNHNMAALYKKIGYENFEALAELMRIVSSKLYAAKFDYKRAMKNLESGIANEETEFLVYVIQQRDQILANMKEYSQSSHMSRGNITINSIILLLMSTFILLYIIITIIK